MSSRTLSAVLLKPRLVLLPALMLALTVSAPADQASAENTKKSVAVTTARRAVVEKSISVAEIKNCLCLVPCLGDGADYDVRLKNGEYKVKNDSVNGYEAGGLTEVAVGSLSGHPAGCGYLIWNTGGSGYWNSLILFRRVNGVLRGVGHFSLGYPVSQAGRLVNLKLVDNSISFDIKDVDVECTAGLADVPDSPPEKQPLTRAEALNASIPLPSRASLRDQGCEIETVTLHDGKYEKGEVKCSITHAVDCQLDKLPATLISARVEYKGAGAPLLIVYRLRRYGGKTICDGYYTLCNDYDLKDISNLRFTTNERFQRQDDVAFDVIAVTLKPKDFRSPNYGK